MDTFTPPQPPDYEGNAIQETPRMNSSQFGDGYKQVIPDGLNTNDATASYQWSALGKDDALALMQFYKAHIGKTFLWDAPGDLIGNGKWRFSANGAKSAVSGYNVWTVSYNLERSFELT